MGGTPNQGQQDPDRSESAADALYLATLAFFDEAAAAGVRHVVVSPGSRSTPLAVAARRLGGLRVWVQLDERVAGFFALGLARSTATPVVLVCTSGTASAKIGRAHV